MSSTSWLNSIGRTLKTNSPAILSGIGVAGVIGTVVLAVKATPKACENIAAAKDEKEHAKAQEEGRSILLSHDEELTIQEIVQCTWKLYLPTALSGAATIGCIIGANSMGARRNAALAGAYALVDQSFKEYKEKVLEQIGETKADKIEDEIAKDRIKNNPPVDNQVIVTGRGEVMCYESITGRYFKSDIESVRKAENTINSQCITDMYASLNDFFDLLGLGHAVVGEELGFRFDHLMEVHYSSHLTECDQPALVLNYKRLPIKDYFKI